MLRKLADDLASVLFPSLCCVCSNPLLRLARTPVCDDCWKRLAPQSGTLCVRCSEDLRISVFTPQGGSAPRLSDQLCQPCRLAAPPFARAVAYGGYTGTLRSLIHALKYDGTSPIAERLGGLLAEAIAKLWDESAAGMEGPKPDVLVIAVPIHASRLKERRFNHAELLASAAVKVLRARRPELRLTLACGVLERKKATQSQAGLSPNQRRANLRGVFFVSRPEEVAGRDVLLIDDIYTTGATARACSSVLRRAGAASVRVATVARPQRENFTAPQFSTGEPPMHEDVAFWGTKQQPSVPQAVIAGGSRASQQQITFRGTDVFGQSHE